MISELSTMLRYLIVIITVIMRLSETDLRLLRMLQQDCRQSINNIAKTIGIPATTAYDKVKRMEKRGVIEGYAALLNEPELGLPTTALVFVSVEYPQESDFSQEAVAQTLSEFPEITDIYIVAGDWDLMLKIKSSSIEDVGDFVIRRLRKVVGVKKTQTIAVFKKVKETPTLPI
jgi:DNA-binding Lrp family transcriptional regulator